MVPHSCFDLEKTVVMSPSSISPLHFEPFINNNNYLNAPTFRGMRCNLLNTFDSIFIINLHGNSKKRETSPDGGKDENVSLFFVILIFVIAD